MTDPKPKLPHSDEESDAAQPTAAVVEPREKPHTPAMTGPQLPAFPDAGEATRNRLIQLLASVEARAAQLRGRLENMAAVSESEATKLRAEVEHLVRQNARLASVYFACTAVSPPEPLDLSPLHRLAEEATGKSWQELAAMQAEPALPSPPVVTDAERRASARRRLVAATPLLPKGESPLELYACSVVDVDPIACDALSAVRSFVADKTLGVLVLSGGVGTFKTGSACWMLAQKGGQYVGASELLRVAFDEKERLTRLREARHVVFDDLGTEVRDERGRWLDVFNALWNGWYGSCAKVVVTCNLSVDQFRAPPERGGYGIRAYDRVRERGRWVTLAGASRRQRRAS